MSRGLHSSGPKSAIAKALLDNLPNQARSAPGGDARPHVIITRCSIGKLDHDNISVKYVLDSIRDSGLIADDDDDSIRLTLEQIKVAHRSEVGTHIRIIYA